MPKKKYNLAINKIKESIKINNKNENAYYNLANIYKSQENFDEAIIGYEKTLKINKNYLKAYLNLGHIFYLKKN